MTLECEVTLTLTCDAPRCGRRSTERIIQGVVSGEDMPKISTATFTDEGWGYLGGQWYCPDHIEEEWARRRREHPLNIAYEPVRHGRHGR